MRQKESVIQNPTSLIKLALLSVLFILALTTLLIFSPQANAATTITVNSTADDTDNDGECTFREAIIASNTDTASGVAAGECLAGSGSDTIEFNISGAADFTNGGQNGYTISPTSQLPAITQTVTINGYSQPGSSANTATSPLPLDTVLLIQIDGTSAAGSHGLRFIGADSSEVRGLVISNWDLDGMSLDSDNLSVTGNYIGTNPAGTVAQMNGDRGLAGWGAYGNSVTIGGTSPSERNLISGNGTVVPGGSGIGMGPNHDNWVIQGNYIGLGADGVTEIPNAGPGGSGSPSVDYVSGTLIGGSVSGAANVISGNNGIGIAPVEAPNTTIEGNFIGTDYTGTVAKPNDGGGIGATTINNSEIVDNIISSNGSTGVLITSSDITTVTGNTIGTGSVGNEDLGNTDGGVVIHDSTNITVGGSLVADLNDIMNTVSGPGVTISGSSSAIRVEGNTIADNDFSGVGTNSGDTTYGIDIVDNTITGSLNGGVQLFDTSQIAIDGNTISGSTLSGITTENTTTVSITGNQITNNVQHGISLGVDSTDITIGGVNQSDANTITGNGNHGIESRYDPNTNTFTALRNSIYDNTELGIALSYASPLANDAEDGDTGPNDLLNYPDNLVYREESGNTLLDFGLDAPAGNYRVEFFSSTAADPSGNGEGQTFLGYQNITHTGSGLENFSTTLAGTNISNISATTTERDNSVDGFGVTSEFSEIAALLPVDLSLSKTLNNPDDVTPGATLTYTLSATNIGGEASDLTQFDGTSFGSPLASSLFVDLLPPQLAFVDASSTNPDITCTDLTPTLELVYFDGFLDTLLINHDAGFTVIACVYTPVSGTLSSGGTISTNINVTVANDATLEWTNYLYGAANGQNDPDAGSILTALGASFGSGGTIDLIDQLEATGSNNYTTAVYPIPEEPESVTSLNPTNTTEDLAETGRRVLPIVVLAMLVIAAGSTSVIWRIRQHQK